MNKERNILYLIWKNPSSHTNHVVGMLTKGHEYSFEYTSDFLAEVKNKRLELLHAFPEPEHKYESKELFPTFASRLPDRKRKDIDLILNKYGLKEFDEFELLRRGGGRLPIDTYSFVDPIFPEDETVEREFFIMGVMHYSFCKKNRHLGLFQINTNDKLSLKRESNNEYDQYAVQILYNDDLIGYVPRYYSEAVCSRLLKGMTYECKVIEINQDETCDECIKVRLTMPND